MEPTAGKGFGSQKLRLHQSEGQWLRHRQGDAAEDFRTVLHDEGSRQRHGHGSRDGLRLHRPPSRLDHIGFSSGRRQRIHHHPPNRTAINFNNGNGLKTIITPQRALSSQRKNVFIMHYELCIMN